MVRVIKGGEEVKISKRAGSYVTLRDLIEWTSKDAVRFFLLSRKPDTEYVFDVDLALAQNNDNPVYYVQYAHARICSVLAAWGGDVASLARRRPVAAGQPAGQALMLLLARYPDMLRRRGRLRAARRDLLPARPGRRLPQLLRRRAHPGGRRSRAAGPAGAGRRHRAGVAQWPAGARASSAPQQDVSRNNHETTTRRHW
jgi:hypothetical protein